MSIGIHNVIFIPKNIVDIIDTHDNTPIIFCGRDSEGNKSLFLRVSNLYSFEGRYKVGLNDFSYLLTENLSASNEKQSSYGLYDFLDHVMSSKTRVMFLGEEVSLNAVYLLNTGEGSFNGVINENGILFRNYIEGAGGVSVCKIGHTEGGSSREVLCTVGSYTKFSQAKNIIREEISNIYNSLTRYRKCDLHSITGNDMFYNMELENKGEQIMFVYAHRYAFPVAFMRKDEGTENRIKENIQKCLCSYFGGN